MPACRTHSVRVGGGRGPVIVITVLLRDSLMHIKLRQVHYFSFTGKNKPGATESLPYVENRDSNGLR